jgi:amicyanin
VEPSLAGTGPKQKLRRRPWRIAALAAASTAALAGCGAGASGYGSQHTPNTAAGPPSTPATLGAGTAGAGAPSPAAATPADVGITNFKFTPASLTVKVGTSVVWTNHDAIAHTVNFTADGINSTVLNQNDQFTHTFTTPGTYDYICSIHPFMHGSVTVTT